MHSNPHARLRTRRRAVALACLALSPAWAAAQSTSATSTSPGTTTIVVTGNPLRSEVGPPASVLTGDALARSRAGTLGDTLSGLPGVAATGFGAQSSRPVIRGLDGDRIRLLDNGASAVDASSLSFDHAAAIDPLVVERFEVLRGPAALLYGGNATGGVVNAIDNRIPRGALGALGGRAELRLGGAARESAGAAVIEAGAGGLNWHADVAARKSRDLSVPRFTPVSDGVSGATTDRVVNSAGTSHAGAVGVSWADAAGYVGVALDTYRNDYGVTVEPDVTIDMRRDRASLAGERRLGGMLDSVEFQLGRTRYKHQEIEGSGEVGTTFESRGTELRLQGRHAALPLGGGTLRGVLGAQVESLDFSALGEEAFVPGTRTRSQAAFALEEWKFGALSLTAGARVERVKVASDGDEPGAPDPRFGPATERRFSPGSAAIGLAWQAAPGFTVSAGLGRTQRAPTYYELYANGVHVATAAYERGDPQLALERSRHVEAGLAWRSGAQTFKASVFSTHFTRYIALEATGLDVLVPGEDGEPDSRVPEYTFRGVRARLTGLELEARAALPLAGLPLAASLTLDGVRGNNRDTGEPLPRLAPLRASATLEADFERWRTGLTVRHAARQNRVPAYDTATPGHTLVDLWATGRLGSAAAWQWFARLANVGDRLASNASAVSTVRGLTPQGGRALTLGLRWQM